MVRQINQHFFKVYILHNAKNTIINDSTKNAGKFLLDLTEKNVVAVTSNQRQF